VEPDLTKLAGIVDGKHGAKAKAILRKLLASGDMWTRLGISVTLRDLCESGIVVFKWVNAKPRSYWGYGLHVDYVLTVTRMLEKEPTLKPQEVARAYAAYMRWCKAPMGQGVRATSDYAGMIRTITGKGRLKAKHISRLLGWGRHMNQYVERAMIEFEKTGMARRDGDGYWIVPNGPAIKAVFNLSPLR